MNEKISVIVPVYKVEKFLDRCVKSLIEQTYTNLEIILVDDGSPDSCPQMCDKWAKKDDRIIVIHQTNKGLSEARNSGMDIATGDYIAFLDSDDYVFPDMYEKLYTALKANNVDLVACGYVDVDEYGNLIKRNVFKGNEFKYEKVYSGKEYASFFFSNLSISIVWDKLYSKEIIGDNRFKPGVACEDILFLSNIINNQVSMVFIEDSLYYYTVRKNSITYGFNEKFYFDRVKNVFDGSLMVEQKITGMKKYTRIAQFRAISSFLFFMPSEYIKNKNKAYLFTLNKLEENKQYIAKTDLEFSLKILLRMFLISKRFAKFIFKVINKVYIK